MTRNDRIRAKLCRAQRDRAAVKYYRDRCRKLDFSIRLLRLERRMILTGSKPSSAVLCRLQARAVL